MVDDSGGVGGIPHSYSARRLLPSIAFLFALALLFFKLPVDMSEMAKRSASPQLTSMRRVGGGVELDSIPVEPVNHKGSVGASKQVMIRKGQVPHMNMFARAVISPGGLVPSNQHADMDEIFHCVGGEGIIVIEGVDTVMHRGTTVHVPAGQMHSLHNTGESNLILLYWGVEVEPTFV